MGKESFECVQGICVQIGCSGPTLPRLGPRAHAQTPWRTGLSLGLGRATWARHWLGPNIRIPVSFFKLHKKINKEKYEKIAKNITIHMLFFLNKDLLIIKSIIL